MFAKFGLCCALLGILTANAGAGDPPDLYIAPYLQNVSPHEITIMWETTVPVVGAVEFGQEAALGNRVAEQAPMKIHEIRLTNLQAGTTYFYRACWDTTRLPAATFSTAPGPGTRNWRFVVYGDNRSNPAAHQKNVEQILRFQPDIVLNTGDLVARGTEYTQWKAQYFDPLRELAAQVPVYTCPGNHERNAANYYNYMSLPDENGEAYYAFDYANAHIISLNSNDDDFPFHLESVQPRWLIRDLETHKDAEWKIVFFHHPLFRCHPTRGINPQRWVWQPIFARYGVDLVINGHDHYYQRTYAVGNYAGGRPARGVVHLISGGGGAGTYRITPKIHAAYRRRIRHIVAFEVMGDRLLARAIDAEGDVFDAFVIDRQAEPSPEEFIAYEVYEFERRLQAAIYARAPQVENSEGGMRIQDTLTVANPFTAPLVMRFSWQGGTSWQLASEWSDTLGPGEAIRLPVIAQAPSGSPYPVPAATLHFSRPDGEIPFRNNRLVFYPLKISRRLQVRPPVVAESPVIDGVLRDSSWRKAVLLPDFIDVQGEKMVKSGLKVWVAGNRDSLFVAAKIHAPPVVLRSGYTGRDNRRAPRDEHFRVHLAGGGQNYTFLVTARGTLYDARGSDRNWNSEFRAATTRTPDGWQVEIAIPLAGLGLDNRNLRLNLARRDAARRTEAELMPTFGRSDRDNRLPTYESDWQAAARYAVLKMN